MVYQRKNQQMTIIKVICVVIMLFLFVTTNYVKAEEAEGTEEIQYIINETILPLQDASYQVGDYRGNGTCWAFAQHVYWAIWGETFDQNWCTEDDMLRLYPQGEDRRITAENAKTFLTAAQPGAVIRLQEDQYAPDLELGNRHSIILLDSFEEGCVLYHAWCGFATVSVCTWEDFEHMFREMVDFGYFKYIKYPNAQPLQPKLMNCFPNKNIQFAKTNKQKEK